MRHCLKTIIWSLSLVSCLLAALAAPGSAQINIRLGPMPPPRVEHYGPPPHRGCFWRRGHWVARGPHWFWVHGRWICRR